MITDKYLDNAEETSRSFSLRPYIQLLKLRLSLTVALSGAVAYLFASDFQTVDWSLFSLFILGGLLVTGSANIINQLFEVEYDKLMKRTMNRPLPSGTLSRKEALVYCVFLGIAGTFIHLYYFNALTAGLSLLSLVLYGFVYTPMKRMGPVSVFVGAFPGALPLLIGWAAVMNNIGFEALLLFGIQFMWQFPHFWAIAWVGGEDYEKAGFRMLPSSSGEKLNALFIFAYAVFLLFVSLLPSMFNLVGWTGGLVVAIIGLLFVIPTVLLLERRDRRSALMVMFASFLYLPVVLITCLVDKV